MLHDMPYEFTGEKNIAEGEKIIEWYMYEVEGEWDD